jgi:hypothetical protein
VTSRRPSGRTRSERESEHEQNRSRDVSGGVHASPVLSQTPPLLRI